MRGCTASLNSKDRLTCELVLDYRGASGVSGTRKEHAEFHAASRTALGNASLKYDKYKREAQRQRRKMVVAIPSVVPSVWASVEIKTQIYHQRIEAKAEQSQSMPPCPWLSASVQT